MNANIFMLLNKFKEEVEITVIVGLITVGIVCLLGWIAYKDMRDKLQKKIDKIWRSEGQGYFY